MFALNGWGGSWRDGIYPFPHYHSTAHEVLGICRGEAKVRFGGDTGIVLAVRAGDVVVIPAGVGHQNLGASADLLVVGAYPRGQSWDLAAAAPKSGHRRSPTSRGAATRSRPGLRRRWTVDGALGAPQLTKQGSITAAADRAARVAPRLRINPPTPPPPPDTPPPSHPTAATGPNPSAAAADPPAPS